MKTKRAMKEDRIQEERIRLIPRQQRMERRMQYTPMVNLEWRICLGTIVHMGQDQLPR